MLTCRVAKFDEANYPQIFSADVVYGERAKQLGLIDDIGTVDSVLKEKHQNAEVTDFSKEKPWEKFV